MSKITAEQLQEESTWLREGRREKTLPDFLDRLVVQMRQDEQEHRATLLDLGNERLSRIEGEQRVAAQDAEIARLRTAMRFALDEDNNWSDVRVTLDAALSGGAHE